MKTYPKILIFVAILSIIIQTIYIYHITTKNLFLPDDAYYYFSLGHNVATGHGPKIDSFNNTTGFQPLWGGICALVFTLVPHKTIAPLILLLISLLTELVTAWLLYNWLHHLGIHPIARSLTTCWWLLSSQMMLNQLNGMETGLAIMLVVAVYYSLKFENPWLTGFLFGLALLARIDTIILGIALSFYWIYHKQFKTSQNLSFWWSYKTILILWVCATIISLPWLLFTMFLQKGPLPESGRAVRLITLFVNDLPYYTMIESIWQSPLFHWEQFISLLRFWNWNIVTLYPLNLIPVFSTIFIIVIFIIVAKHYHQKPAVNIFILHALGFVVAYSLFVGGSWYHFRYTAIIGLLFSGLLAGLFYDYVQHRRRRMIYISIVSATILALHIIFSPGLTYPSENRFYYEESFYDSVMWMNTTIPPNALVGMFQSGLMGYYANFPVLNLDGKVNHEAYLALKDKKMWSYICSQQIEYIADWVVLIDWLLIKRSSVWQDDNLILLEQIDEIGIYAVNLKNCSL